MARRVEQFIAAAFLDYPPGPKHVDALRPAYRRRPMGDHGTSCGEALNTPHHPDLSLGVWPNGITVGLGTAARVFDVDLASFVYQASDDVFGIEVKARFVAGGSIKRRAVIMAEILLPHGSLLLYSYQ